jgi:hypothetical protein
MTFSYIFSVILDSRLRGNDEKRSFSFSGHNGFSLPAWVFSGTGFVGMNGCDKHIERHMLLVSRLCGNDERGVFHF